MTRNSQPAAPRHEPPLFVDSHCHLDGEPFLEDLSEVLDRSRALGVTRWINVGYAPERWYSTLDLVARHEGMSCMLGVHPGHAESWSDEVHAELAEAIRAHQPVAVGEIGLDFYRGETNVDVQREAFTSQLQLAADAGIPAVIHMRDSEPLLLDHLQRQSSLPRLVFHSYEGSAALTDWILAHDAVVGVGGLATRTKAAHVREQIRRLALDRIILETDSPYLVPNGFKHRRNTPESIPVVASVLAGLFETNVETVASVTTATCERFFDLELAKTGAR